jgi:hypothetical protein
MWERRTWHQKTGPIVDRSADCTASNTPTVCRNRLSPLQPRRTALHCRALRLPRIKRSAQLICRLDRVCTLAKATTQLLPVVTMQHAHKNTCVNSMTTDTHTLRLQRTIEVTGAAQPAEAHCALHTALQGNTLLHTQHNVDASMAAGTHACLSIWTWSIPLRLAAYGHNLTTVARLVHNQQEKPLRWQQAHLQTQLAHDAESRAQHGAHPAAWHTPRATARGHSRHSETTNRTQLSTAAPGRVFFIIDKRHQPMRDSASSCCCLHCAAHPTARPLHSNRRLQHS